MEVRRGDIDENKAAMTQAGVLKTVGYFEAQLVRKDRTDGSGRHRQSSGKDPPLEDASHLQPPPPQPRGCPGQEISATASERLEKTRLRQTLSELRGI